MKEDFDALKQHHRERIDRNLDEAERRFDELPEGTIKHTRWHWKVGDVNYWPSRNKWQPKGGRVITGTFQDFLNWLGKR